MHTTIMHANVKYSCNNRDYKATKSYYLKMHHEGIHYYCTYCKATNILY